MKSYHLKPGVARKKKTLPHFKYWLTVHDMELSLLRFVHSIRIEDNCRLGLHSGSLQLCPLVSCLCAEYNKSADKTPGSLQSLC